MAHEETYTVKRGPLGRFVSAMVKRGPVPRARSSSPTQYSKPFKYKLKEKSLKPREKYGPHYPNRYEVGQGGSKGLATMKRAK